METRQTEPLDILILGGTGFIGPHQVEAARARGHRVTIFNRGQTNTHLFPDIEKLHGDRDPDKGDGLNALAGRSWDVVIDNSGYFPRHVGASAELLAPNAKQYIFVSSISAYADNSIENQDETATLATMPDSTLEDFKYYGPLKVLCEEAVQQAFPERATIVRPGFIVGPGDTTGRFTYWPARLSEGGNVLAPGAPDDPIQVIDARDLADFIVLLAENGTTGVFNACGPAQRTGMGEVLNDCKAASQSDATITWIPGAFLQEQLQEGEGFPPIWVPYEGEYVGFHTWSNARAMDAGLTLRPVEETCVDTLAWLETLPAAERERCVRRFLSADREAEIIANFNESVSGAP